MQKKLIIIFLVLVSLTPLWVLTYQRYILKNLTAKFVSGVVADTTSRIYPNENVLWDLVQEWRVDNGYAEYKKSQTLCEYAERRAQEVEFGFSHKEFLEKESQKMFSETNFSLISENLASHYWGEQSYLDAWVHSSTHLNNLVADHVYSCIKCRKDYCVQLFAK